MMRMFFGLPRDKRGMMGVSTLIIFITAILVSAVAASVIVRTVGVLQERAFTVGTDVRNRLVTALDFISITSYNNVTEEISYGVTILVRTRAGSYAYDLATAGLLVTTNEGTLTAELQNSENEDLNYDLPRVTNTSYTTLIDIDGDKIAEQAKVTTDIGNDRLEIKFSRTNVFAYADLGVDLTVATPVNLSINDTPIIATDGRWLGFLQATGNATMSTLDTVNATINITRYPVRDYCSFETLIPDTAFCYEVQLGNEDSALTKGELYKIYYRVRPQNYFTPNEDFEFKFIPKNGDYTSAVGKMPDSIVRDSGQVWPTTLES